MPLPNIPIQVGQSIDLYTTLFNSIGVILTGRTGVWSTSNSSLATVDENGVLTAISAGTCNVIITVEGRTFTRGVVVSVGAPILSLTTSVPSMSFAPGGAAASVVVRTWSGLTGTGTEQAGRTITAVSSSPAVAAVEASKTSPGTFLVTPGGGSGSTTITFTSEGVTVTLDVTVIAVDHITWLTGDESVTEDAPNFTDEVQTWGDVGETIELLGRMITISDPNPAVATRSPANGPSVADGLVITFDPQAPGSAAFVASCEGKTATKTLTVTPAGPTPEGELAAWQAAVTGGDASIIELRTANYGADGGVVFDGSNKVSAVKDLRVALGGAAGDYPPDMVQATAAEQPTYTPATKSLDFTAGTVNMVTAVSAKFDISGARTRISILSSGNSTSGGSVDTTGELSGLYNADWDILAAARDPGLPAVDANASAPGVQTHVDSGGHVTRSVRGAPNGTAGAIGNADGSDKFVLVIVGKDAATGSWVELPNMARVAPDAQVAPMPAGNRQHGWNFSAFGEGGPTHKRQLDVLIDHVVAEGSAEMTAILSVISTYYPDVTLLP